jgi:hypothetical protein
MPVVKKPGRYKMVGEEITGIGGGEKNIIPMIME